MAGFLDNSRELRLYMATRRRWSELSDRSRRLIIAGAAFEGVLKVMALADIKHRPANQIRGSKSVWATAVVLVNSAGAVPLAYFLFGRSTPHG
ncbi:hypothetical protein [Rhodococcus koreensis]